jgi:dCTP deaminase
MAVLSDRDIRRRLRSNRLGVSVTYEGYPRDLGISPFEYHQIQPASIDLTLANEWRMYPSPEVRTFRRYEPLHFLDDPIDMDHAGDVETIKIIADEYSLQPHELILCSTLEYVDIPHDIQAQVHGKSSLGRLGLLVHITAGFIDPGFKGKITLEMYNLNNKPIILRAGKPICQLGMTRLSCPAEFPYGHPKLNSKYQDQREVTGSRYDG